MTELEQVHRLLEALTAEQRRQVFDRLRKEFPIHPLEQRVATQAEVILEAFDRAGPFTFRMFRGVIAEAAFAINIVDRLDAWEDETRSGEHPYDFRLRGPEGEPVRVQVKLQRSGAGEPLVTTSRRKDRLPAGMFVVETDKSRQGLDASGQSTRGYRFGSFDILAVSLFPSTQDWSRFRYTLERWLWPRPTNPEWIYKYQPVAREADEDWTDDFQVAVEWLRSGVEKRIAQGRGVGL